MCLTKNVIVKQIEKKSLKNTKENLLNRKISKKYFWIFHLTRLRELEIEFSSLLFVSFEGFSFVVSIFPVSNLKHLFQEFVAITEFFPTESTINFIHSKLHDFLFPISSWFYRYFVGKLLLSRLTIVNFYLAFKNFMKLAWQRLEHKTDEEFFSPSFHFFDL